MGSAVPVLACHVAPAVRVHETFFFTVFPSFKAPSRSWEGRWGFCSGAVNRLVFEEVFACGQRDRESWG